MEAYLDNSATTRCIEVAVDAMQKAFLVEYGNPSSLHKKGMEAEKLMKESREIFSKILKVDPAEIIFTSGGTESDNLAIIGAAMALKRRGKHLITSKIEHPAVLRTMEYLAEQGFEITYLSTDKNGQILIEELKQAMREDTILVSIMHTNNEIGAVQHISEIGKLIKEMNRNTLFHVDAVQGFGKAFIYPRREYIDMLSISGHKIHGPKGVGVLYKSSNVRLIPITYGGGQQKSLRSGTENVPGIIGIATAAKHLYDHLEEDLERMIHNRNRLVEGIRKLDGTVINSGIDMWSAPHIVSASIRDVRSEVLLHSLEEKGIYVSSGSACASNKIATSDTLKAIGVEKWQYDSTIRFSLSCSTTEEEIDYTLKEMCDMIPLLRRFTRH